MSLVDVLKLLKQHKIQISLENDQLKVNAAKGAMTKELMLILKENKPALLAWAQEQQALSSSAQSAIQTLPRNQAFPLSFNQQRLWLLHKIAPETASYNMPMALKLSGNVNVAQLEQALNLLIERHEVFRVRLDEDDSGTAFQTLAQDASITLTPSSLENHQVSNTIQQSAIQAFQLKNSPLFRVELFQLSDEGVACDEYILLFNIHHIIGDRVSIETLFQELGQVYLSASTATLPPKTIDYLDYAAWQNNDDNKDLLSSQITYWKDYLSGTAPSLNLPSDEIRHANNINAKAKQHLFTLDETLAQQCNSKAKQLGLTPFMFYFAAQQLLFSKLSQQDDFCTAVPIAGRHIAGTENLIGYFVNTLALRNNISENPSLDNFLKNIKYDVLNAFDNQDAPLDQVIASLNLAPSSSHSTLIQTGFNYINQQVDTDNLDSIQLGDIAITPLELGDNESKYEQIWSITDKQQFTKNRIDVAIEYNSTLFKDSSITWFSECYTRLLTQLVNIDLETPVKSIALCTQNTLASLAIKTLEAIQSPYEIERLLPLTPMQRDLHIDSAIAQGATRNYFGQIVHLSQALDHNIAQQALALITEKYSTLRQRIIHADQLFTPAHGLDHAYAAILKIGSSASIIQLEHTIIHEESEQAFTSHCEDLCYQTIDCAQAPLFRFNQIDRCINQHTISSIVISAHHSAIDVVGMNNIAKQLSIAYHGLISQHTKENILSSLAHDSFPDYIQQKITATDNTASIQYWIKKSALVETPSSTNALAKAEDAPNKFNNLTAEIDNEHLENIKRYTQQHAISMVSYLKACFSVCLASHTHHRSGLYFDEAIASRPRSEKQGIACYFEQRPVIVEQDFLANKNTMFLNLCQHIEAASKEAAYHYPLSNKLHAQYFPAGQASYQFNFYMPETDAQFNHQTATYSVIPPLMDNAVNFMVISHSEHLTLNIRYFEQHLSGQSFLPQFIQLSQSACHNPSLQVGEGLSPAAQLDATQSSSLAIQNYLHARPFTPLIQSIYQQAALTPHATALSQQSQSMSYHDLIEHVEALAQQILSSETQGQIGICLERGNDFIIAVLASLRTGRAYIPIDSSYPEERIEYILTDAKAHLIISNSSIKLNDGNAQRFNIDTLKPTSQSFSDNINFSFIQESDAFYTIYTSGSTGKPKGASVSQRNAQLLSQWYQKEYAIDATDNVYILSAVGFDLTQKNFFAPLLAGASIVFPTAKHYDESSYLNDIEAQQISFINCAPSAFYPIAELAVQHNKTSALQHLRYVLFGGESISMQRLLPWLQNERCQAQLVNMYGPTECTDITTAHIIDNINDGNAVIPIGTTPPFVQAHIVDPWLNPVAQGCAGELVISGASVGLGYLDRDELNEQIFIDKSTLAHHGLENIASDKLYRTGDFVVQNTQQAYIFLSRLDHQVKIRGLRIELGEIEQQINQLTDYSDSLCIVDDENIIAYALSTVSTQEQSTQWRTELAKTLPDYMLPAQIISLEKWPLTANGKIDRQALPAAGKLSLDIIPARNEIEQQLVDIWQSVLGIEPIGIYNNFFELGGHSLLAARIATAIKQHFNVEVSLRDVFEEPTIAHLATIIEQADQHETYTPPFSLEHQPPETAAVLSPAQERLWFIDQLSPGSNQYNIPFALKLTGSVHIEALQKSFSALIQRHSNLRLNIHTLNAQASLTFDTQAELKHHIFTDDEAALKRYAGDFLLKPFNLSTEPLIRMELVEHQSESIFESSSATALSHQPDFLLLLSIHHIIADGWSIDIFVRDLIAYYQHFAFNSEINLPVLDFQYSDYAWSERQATQSLSDTRYWQQRLQVSEICDLPCDFERPSQLSEAGAQLTFELPTALSEKIKQYTLQQQSTLFNTLQASFSLLLSQYSGQNDIVLGTPVANRSRLESQNIIGFFANTLALRTQVDQSDSFNDLLKQVRKNNLNDFEHQSVQFEHLVEQLDVTRELNQTPLFNVMLVLQANSQSAQQDIQLPNLNIQPVDQVDQINSAKFDLTLNIADAATGIKATFEYRTALFKRETIEQLYQHFKELLNSVLAQPDQALQQLNLFNLQAPSISAANNNWPAMQDYRFTPFIQRFELHANNTPNAVAVSSIDGNGTLQQLSFQALNETANYLAHTLVQQGVQPQQAVAICLPRGIAMMQALLAVQKTGAVYVPVDLSLPADRAAYMIENSQAQCVIINNESLSTSHLSACFSSLAASQVQLINTESLSFDDNKACTNNLNNILEKSDLAYILYTSGSTGKPKGTLIEQLGFDHYLQFAATSYYQHAKQSIVSSSLSFDATITSLYSALCQGKPCYITQQSDDKFEELAQLIFNDSTPSLFKITPAHIELFSAQYANNQASNTQHIFIIGGDQLKTHQLLSFQKLLPNSIFVNEYGPTETVVGCCVEFVTPATDIEATHPKVINIGEAISYTSLLVLDPYQRLVPKGVAGELYIGGYGVGRGYLEREEETQSAFLDNPFTSESSHQHIDNSQRLYRSGDIVKQQSDGKLVYLGRADDQIKIRGLRIELGEIEHQLSAIDGIQEPIVLAKTQPNQEPVLVAYYLSDESLTTDENGIKQILLQTLPSYMLPSAFCSLSEMPLTPNGKVDKKALLALNIQSTKKQLVHADTELEVQLSQLWSQLLAKENLSVNESFFELGGHSLLAIRLASNIEQTFSVAFSVRQVFEYASIRAMANYIEQASPLDATRQLAAIKPVPRDEKQRIPLSFNQQRLWFVYQLDKSAGSYNMPTALRIKGELNLSALEQAAHFLIQRHELLRTLLHEDGEGSFQEILLPSEVNFQLNIQAVDIATIDDNKLQALLRQQSILPFELDKEAQFRVSLWQTQNTENQEPESVLLINLHHIIGDAISLEMLVGELVHCYMAFAHQQQPQLLAQTIQYADYAQWQQDNIQGEYLETQLNWWQEKLSGAPALLNLPCDHTRPARQEYQGKTLSTELPAHIVKLIREHALATGLTPFMILLAAQKLLLAKLSNQDDICIGVPLAGRHTLGTESLLGFFINALAIRTKLADNPNCEDFLQSIKHNVLAAFAHQDAPFEKVIERLQLDNNPSYSPLVQVGFNYIHQQQSSESRIQAMAGEFGVEGIDIGNSEAKYDQIWAFLDNQKGIHLSLEYKTSLFEHSTIEHWIESYYQLLETLISKPQTPIKKITYLNQESVIDGFDWSKLNYKKEHIERIEHLTPMQRDMFIDQLLAPDNRRNYLGWIQHADQIIDVNIFQQAVDILKNNHSALRMRIIESNHALSDVAYQIILNAENCQVKVQSLDWSTAGEQGQPLTKPAFDKRCNKLGFAPYDMANDSLIRLFIIKDTATSHTIVLSAHHTCIDGLSMQAITNAYTDLYSRLKANEIIDGAVYFGEDLYPNYVEQQYLHCDNKASLEFWQKTMTEVEPPKPFNSGSHSNAPQYFSREIKDSPQHMANIQAYCKQHNIAEITYLKSVYALMIQSECYGQEDFYFSEILAARPKGHHREIGCYFEQRPTVVPAQDLNQKDFLHFLQAMENYRLDVRSAGRISNGLQQQTFQQGPVSFLFNFYLMPRTLPFDEGHLRMNFITPEMTDAVTLTCIIDDDSLLFTFSYTDNVFEDNQFIERFISLSEQIIAGENNIEKLRLHSDDHSPASDVTNHQNAPAVQYSHRSVIDAIEQQVKLTPQAIACTSNDETLTYQQLNQQADNLAIYLSQHFSIQAEDSIAICLPSSNQFLVSLLAVLKTGAYYIPVDSSYPSGRIIYMLDNAQAKCLISDADTISQIDNETSDSEKLTGLKSLCLIHSQILSETPSEIHALNLKTQRQSLTLNSPLYAIYTSGSTGLPKGALVSQRGELNLIEWYNDTFSFGQNDTTLIISSMGFDLTQKNLLAPLCTGASIVFNTQDYDPEVINSLIAQHKITYINCAPSAFYPLLDAAKNTDYQALNSLRTVLFGGEPIRSIELSNWISERQQEEQSETVSIVNMYGPTECTDIASYYIVNNIQDFDNKAIPIGMANTNVQLHILDAGGKILPKGMTGELCISGESLGLGYIANETLSQSVFTQHPVLGNIYHTGDLVKYLPDGNFEFVSRVDHQVKIRGLRIELGEIEWQLKNISDVRDALVLAHNDNLLAYILSDQTPENWRQSLAHSLPAYMLPQHLFCLSRWPLTANGKIDRKALPTHAEHARLIIAPNNETQATLLEIFQRHLARNDISIDDNFFDIGGHSLLAARAVADIRESFQQELPLREVFFSPSIESIAKLLNAGTLTAAQNLLPALEALSSQQQQAIHADTSQGQYPLSVQQQRLWLIEQIQGSSTMYSMPLTLSLSGSIDIAALRLAVSHLAHRHIMLRARMSLKDNKAYQYIHHEDLTLQVHRFDNENSRQRSIAWDIQKPFNPSHDEALFIAHAYILNNATDNELILLINQHHIISDGLSNSLILQELATAYQQSSQGDLNLNSEDEGLSYLDYTLWQQELISQGIFEKQLEYWQEKLHKPTVLQLPIDFAQTAKARSNAGALHSFEISEALQDSIKSLAQALKVSEFSLYLSAFAFLLSRYSTQDDIIIGTAVANRPLNAMNSLVGLFVNTLALRLDTDKTQTLDNFIQQAQQTLDSALEQQSLPFEQLLDALNLERDLSHSPVFQAFFNYQSLSEHSLESFDIDGMTVQPYEPIQSDAELQRQAKFEISLNVTQLATGCSASIEYRSNLFSPSTIERFADHFVAVLKSFQHEKNACLSHINFLSPQELDQQVLSTQANSLNNTQVDFQQSYKNFSTNKGIHQYFEDQVSLSLHSPAVTDTKKTLSYLELNQLANQLARHLIELGVKPGDSVAICMTRCRYMSVALLAALKCGAHYIPFDPSFPIERLQFMAQDTQAKIVLFNRKPLDTIDCEAIASNLSIPTVIAADNKKAYSHFPNENLNIAIDKNTTFNIIYTSGSTGKPKGVIVPHSGIINRLLWMQSSYAINADDNILQKTPYSFDVSVWELFWPLMFGSQLIFAKPEGHKDPDYLLHCIQHYNISTLHFVPSMLAVFLNSIKKKKQTALRQVFCSGEALQVQHVNHFYQAFPQSQLHNLYGPTEASIDVSFYHCKENDSHASVPIGKPIANTQLLILDELLNVQPIGIAGELYIGGDNLATGYLNRDELNAQTFITNPYFESHQHPSKQLYKTGDVVRLLNDGNIAYLGRSDHQVKIRGLRIELGEIENALLAIQGVNEACVLAQTLNNDDYLCAYIAGQISQSQKDINRLLAKQLPQYMLPQFIHILDALPLSANGKIDRKLLPSLSDEALASKEEKIIVKPLNDIEALLLNSWRTLLGIEHISCDDNFFAIGGHSLKAASLVSLIREKFAVDVQLRDIFDHTSISEQAILIEQRQQFSTPLPKIESSITRQNLPLSYAQQRLWFLSQMDPNSIVYNMPAAIRLTGKINKEALEESLAELIQRHEILRSNMCSDAGEPILVIHEQIKTPLQFIHASSQEELQSLSLKDASTPFNLAEDALLRCSLISLNDGEHALVINMHHIISDAWSIQILIKELAMLYIGNAHQQFIRLPDLNIQYADFSQWQRNWLQGEVLDQQIGYWRKTLAGAPELLSLPTDFSRPDVQSFKGKLFKGEIDPSLVEKLKQVSQHNQCTLFMTCLSAYALLLQQHSKQNDICVGIPLAGRSLEGVDQLIGFFINALVIRNDLSANLNLKELLAQTKQQVLAAFAHEHVPIEMLLNELDIERSLAYTPIAQCAFNMITADNSINEIFDSANLPISMELIETEQVVAKFDMQFSLLEFEGSINVSIEYASDLFTEETIAAFYHGYIYMLEEMCSNNTFSIYQLQKEFNLDKSQAYITALPPVIEDMYLGTVARPDTLENSMGYGLDLPIDINEVLWQQALTEVAQQHSMCRAYIAPNSVSQSESSLSLRQLEKNIDLAVFHVQPPETFSIGAQFELIDFSDEPITLDEIRKLAENNSNVPYPAGAQLLIQYRLYKLSESHYYFNMTCSHLISDGLSALNHAALLAKQYENLLAPQPVVIQKDDAFPAYIQQSLQTFDLHSSLIFWQERLAGVEGLSCRALNEDTQILKTLPLTEDHFIAIKQFCKQNVITPAIYFKAIYAILIKLYTRTESDFTITEFNPGRNKDNLQDLGCFFHSQPFLIQIDSLSDQLKHLFKALKSEQKANRRHLKISNRQLQNLLPASQLQFSFNFLAFDHHIHLNELRIDGDRFTPNADGLVDFRVQADGNDVSLWLAYNGLLFDDKDFIDRYLHISQQLLNSDIQTLNQIEYVLPNELIENQLDTITEEKQSLPLVHQLISQTAAQYPNNIAIISGENQLSYAELEKQANALANLLIQEGVKAGDRVSLLLPKRVELISCLLACIKVGACYVPIDTHYPQDRIHYILEDSQSTLCITQNTDIDNVPEQIRSINIDTIDLSSLSHSAPFADVKPDDAIYMIYTSGSTGKPKAASVYHHSEVRLLDWYCQEYSLIRHDKTLVISATGFDLSQKNFFALLTQGGTVVFPSSLHFDVNSILNDISQHQISVINCAPSAFYPLVELNNDIEFSQLASLKHVLFGGESIQLQRLQSWISSDKFNCSISNMYGPTECTDISTSYNLNASRLKSLAEEISLSSFTFPLGTVSAGTEIVLLDENLQRVPPGLHGEICISGPQVGLGYWQQENLTNNVFVSNPYASTPYNQRLYKTGDLAYLEKIDGEWQLIYIGRKDFQVKLHGMRIELGEIESAINTIATIKDSTVLVENDELLAFVLSDHAEASNWRDILSQQLPDYMVPKSLIFLNDWPLTPNGKVDRKALLKIPRSQLSSNQFTAPRTTLEKDLASLWKEVLGVGDVGVHDNFFESGGDSLKAVRFIARLEMRFEVKVPVASLFGAQTISQLAHIIHNEIHDWSPIVPIQPQGNKTPIFAVHALGAMVLSYEPLSRALGKNQPFYGIQAYGFEDEQTPYTNLDEMVSFYTQAILDQQPEGPYQLIGHSFGGIIALEIARKLKSLGEEVSYLAMLDTHMPIRYQAISLDDAGILKIFAEHNFGVVDIPLKTLRLMKPEMMIKKVSEQFNGAVSENFIKSAIAIIRGFQKMMISYKAEPLDIDIVLIRPTIKSQNIIGKLKGKLFKESAKTLGWHQVARHVEVVNVAGDHHTMLNKSHAEGLSLKVLRSLADAKSKS